MSEVAERPKVEKKEAALPVLPPSQNRFSITEAGYAYAEIDVTQPVGHSIEDALRPEYWVHHSHKLKARAFTGEADRTGAIIRLRTDDHAYFATLYVRAVGEHGLVMQLLTEPVYLGPKSVETTGFDVRWNVGNRGFDVIRKSDRSIVADSKMIKTREQASIWINETMKAA